VPSSSSSTVVSIRARHLASKYYYSYSA